MPRPTAWVNTNLLKPSRTMPDDTLFNLIGAEISLDGWCLCVMNATRHPIDSKRPTLAQIYPSHAIISPGYYVLQHVYVCKLDDMIDTC